MLQTNVSRPQPSNSHSVSTCRSIGFVRLAYVDYYICESFSNRSKTSYRHARQYGEICSTRPRLFQ